MRGPANHDDRFTNVASPAHDPPGVGERLVSTPDMDKPLAPPWPGRPAGTDLADDELKIGELVGTLLEHKWLMLLITSLAVAIGLVAAYAATPVFRADALLQIDEQSKPSLALLKELEPIVGDKTSLAAELEILQSRMVLGRAIEAAGLEILAEPRYAPVLGRYIASGHVGAGLREPLFGQTAYAWGGESIRVAHLQVPAALLDAVLTLVSLGEGRYRLTGPGGVELLTGLVGQDAVAPDLRIRVETLQARAGTQFDVVRSSQEEALRKLRSSLSVSERGRQSGIVNLGMTGPNRAQLPLVLDEIIGIYHRQNVERRSSEADSQLRFLEAQLPTLKSQLDAAEAAYNAYRQRRGSVDLELETQSVLKSLVDIETEIARLRQEREELRQGFTPQHPRIVALDAKLRLLDERRTGFDRGVSRLPDTQQTALRLRRDVEVSTTLYVGLLSTAQQLRITRAGTVGDVRIIDAATVGRYPVQPRRQVIVATAALLGLALSLAAVFLLRAMRVAVEDPDTIERKLGLPVLASIPHSKAQAALTRHGKRRGPGSGGALLAVSHPEDDAVESFRSLRASLHFSMLAVPRKSLLITGPKQSIGKSFVAKNIAVVLAQAGKRVVVIDADLRKGHLHEEFRLQRGAGVSDYVTGRMALHEILRATEVENLSVVTTGELPSNPSELLMHARFDGMLRELEAIFDLLIVDAPPILAVADAAIIGRHSGATILVARAGSHPVRELDQAVRRLQQAGVSLNGVVFNDLDVRKQRYRYGHEGYVYRYTYKAA